MGIFQVNGHGETLQTAEKCKKKKKKVRNYKMVCALVVLQLINSQEVENYQRQTDVERERQTEGENSVENLNLRLPQMVSDIISFLQCKCKITEYKINWGFFFP